MSSLNANFNKWVDIVCASAWIINVGLFVFASIEHVVELQVLSLVNAFLLSFRVLRVADTND